MLIKVYKGMNGIKKNIREFDRMQKAGEVVFSFGYEGGFDKIFGNVNWSKKKTKFSGIFSWHKSAKGSTSKRTKIQYVKAGKGNIEVAIWKDTVRIFVFTKKPSVIMIKDKDIVKGFKNYWNFMWKNSKKP